MSTLLLLLDAGAGTSSLVPTDVPGHGTLGVASGLRSFADLLRDENAVRQPYVELRPSLVVPNWNLYSGAIYQASVNVVHDSGRRLDIMSVRTLRSSAALTRAESLASMTAGSWFFDVEAFPMPSSVLWGDGVTKWGDGVTKWGGQPTLYVWLADSSNPYETTVVVSFGIFLGTEQTVWPDLGPDKYAGGGAVNAPVVQRAWYRVCGSYKQTGSGGGIAISDVAHTGSLSPDGRSTVSFGTKLVLKKTGPETRRFLVDFLSPWTTLQLDLSDAGIVFSDISVHRIWGWHSYDPRIGSSALPAVQVGGNGILFAGGKRSGSGTLRVNVGDRLLDSVFGKLDTIGCEILIRVGGYFLDDQDVPYDDHRHYLTGSVRRGSSFDAQDTVQLDVVDTRDKMHKQIPDTSYNLTDNPDMASGVEGTPKVMLLGSKTNITTPRIGKVGEYGLYEVADCRFAPNGIFAISVVRSYVDADAATREDSTRAFVLTAGTDYSVDLTHGRFTVLRDVRTIEIVAGTNDRLDFNDGGVKAAIITPGVYTIAALVTHAVAQLNAVSSGFTGAYSDSTHLVTFTKSSGTFSVLLGSGVNKDRSAWKTFGLTGSADLTGALAYTGVTVLFTDVDRDHSLLRVDASGYKDTGAGTYTGSAGALIEKAGDQIAFLWVVVLQRDPASVDWASIASARTSLPQRHGVYIKTVVSSLELFTTYELACQMDIVIDADGMLQVTPYSTTLLGSELELLGDEILSAKPSKEDEELYSTIIVEFDEDPTSGSVKTRQRVIAATGARFGARQPQRFRTFLLDGTDANATCVHLVALAQAPPERLDISSLILLDTEIGDRLILSLDRDIYSMTGSQSRTGWRIVELVKDLLQGVIQVKIVELVQED